MHTYLCAALYREEGVNVVIVNAQVGLNMMAGCQRVKMKN